MIEAVLSVLGSVTSIGAAIWAFVEAGRAKHAAQKAETVRSELIGRRKLVEVSQLLSETRRVLQSVSRVGPACTEKKLRGVDCAEIAREVEEYSRLVGEAEEHFAIDFQNHARELRADLAGDIRKLADAATFEQKRTAGMILHQKIDNFLPKVKSILDDKQEHSVAIGREEQR